MVTLNDVQNEVTRQLIRDYGNEITPTLQANVMFGLAEEAGEVVGLMKRVLRNFPKDKARATKENFIDEMGDVLWYLAACCETQGTSLEEIWRHNICKLQSRYGNKCIACDAVIPEGTQICYNCDKEAQGNV